LNILIIKLSSIGDVVHTLPSLAALRSLYPTSRIDWVVEEEAHELLKDNPLLNEAVPCARKKWLHNLTHLVHLFETIQELFSFLKKIRLQEYDIVIDFQGLFKSGILTFFSRGTRKVGYDRSREFSYLFLNEKVKPYDRNAHAVERYLNLITYLGAEPGSCSFPIAITPEVRENVQRLLQDNGIRKDILVIVLSPWARWKSKLWGAYNFARLADLLIDNFSAQVILTGSRENSKGNAKILSLMKNKAHDLAGKTTLRELACLFTLSDYVVTVDSGPLHIASAVNAPLISLFGPTAPWRTGPYPQNQGTVIRKDLPCSPCFKRTCKKPICMKDIAVEEVFNVLISKVKEKREPKISQEERRAV
jgi:3-deoxy-D-manno-octulosonic-acid transferase/heptosyltransferase-1